MTNPSKPQTTWAPNCPKCPETAITIQEHHSYVMAGEWVSLTMTCQNGHAWVAEYLVADPARNVS